MSPRLPLSSAVPALAFALLLAACARTPVPAPAVAAAGPAAAGPATAAAVAPAPVGAAPAATVPATAGAAAMAQTVAARPARSPAPAAGPRILVHKTPTCGCCRVWVEHLIADGFAVEVRDVDDLGPIKAKVGVPPGKGSCHTAEVGGYFVEGHVPAADIRRLLAERPKARGITVPGMPLGSPGMELPDGRVEPYTVELVRKDGSTAAWAQHGR